MKSNEALKDVKVETQYTEGLGVKYVTEPKGTIEGKTISWATIGKEEQVTILGSTNFHKPTPSSSLSLSGHIEYKVEGSEDAHSLDFDIPYKAEQKVEIHSSLRNTRLFAEKANKMFHVAIVDVNDVGMSLS